MKNIVFILFFLFICLTVFYNFKSNKNKTRDNLVKIKYIAKKREQEKDKQSLTFNFYYKASFSEQNNISTNNKAQATFYSGINHHIGFISNYQFNNFYSFSSQFGHLFFI